MKVEISVTKSGRRKNDEWNEEFYVLKRQTRNKALRRWKNQK